MVQHMTRRLLLLQLLGWTALCAAAVHWLHHPLLIAASESLLALLAARMAITINSFALAWRYRSDTPVAHRLDIGQIIRLFFVEFYASMWSSSWAMPFLCFSDGGVTQSNGLPVLLVHGYGCNSGYWHAMHRAMVRAGIVHQAIDLEPVFGDIEEYVPLVQQAVDELCRSSGHGRIVIVAHSMGGLAARAYLHLHGGTKIARLITIGTPHHGTAIANFGVGMNCRQMHSRATKRHGPYVPSLWLRKLDEGEGAAMRASIVSIYSHHDNIVAPQTSAHLDGARNMTFEGIGHVALALHPRIHACVIDEIRAASVHGAPGKLETRDRLALQA
jgi:triacylglycerol esterase/lipase EstA (alpha/beta hydrolase family)